MVKNTAQHYLESQIKTAPKEQLLLMLFDGAIRFTEQGKIKITEKDIEGSCKLLIRAQRIMVELIGSLDKKTIGEELYGNLIRLYNFVYFRLIRANIDKDIVKVDEALRILYHLRETWAQAIEKDRLERYPEAALVSKAEGGKTESGPADFQG